MFARHKAQSQATNPCTHEHPVLHACPGTACCLALLPAYKARRCTSYKQATLRGLERGVYAPTCVYAIQVVPLYVKTCIDLFRVLALHS